MNTYVIKRTTRKLTFKDYLKQVVLTGPTAEGAIKCAAMLMKVSPEQVRIVSINGETV